MRTPGEICALVMVAVIGAGGIARAETATRVIAAGSIERHAVENGATYYVVPLDLLAGMQPIRHAWLELRMDVSSSEVNGFTDPAPILEVYALKEPLTGEVSLALFAATRVPMSRPVAMGESRRVRIDVTEVVCRIAKNTSDNHGLVVGSVTPGNRGIFSIGSLNDTAILLVIHD